MSFWTTQRIRVALSGSSPPIQKGNLTRINNACYEMVLGHEAFITSSSETKEIFGSGDQIKIPPGQLALLMTEEILDLPLNILAFISIKASKKISGLVNVSGFHVDPGFKGRLKFSVYNAGSKTVVLDVGRPLFPIWFYELPEKNEDGYVGDHKNQMEIEAKDVERMQGEVASPAELKKQIEELSTSMRTWKATILSVGIPVIGILIALIAILINLIPPLN